MFDKGQALLLWALECQPEMAPEWNEWYNREHVAALQQVPGFISANRYEKIAEAPLPPLSPMPALPLYLSFYELYDEHVLNSEAYHINRWSKAPGMRPEWTKRMLTYLTRITGGTYRPLTDTWFAGSERAAHTLWAIFLSPVEGRETGVDLWYRERLLPSLESTGFVNACRLFGALDAAPDVKGMVRQADRPRRIVLTAVGEGSINAASLHDTWEAAKGWIGSAAGVLYRRIPL